MLWLLIWAVYLVYVTGYIIALIDMLNLKMENEPREVIKKRKKKKKKRKEEKDIGDKIFHLFFERNIRI